MTFFPPVVPEAVPVTYGDYLDWNNNYYCMQEALLAEWLIEYGFMNDPTDFIVKWGTNKEYSSVFIVKEWICEDKTI